MSTHPHLPFLGKPAPPLEPPRPPTHCLLLNPMKLCGLSEHCFLGSCTLFFCLFSSLGGLPSSSPLWALLLPPQSSCERSWGPSYTLFSSHIPFSNRGFKVWRLMTPNSISASQLSFQISDSPLPSGISTECPTGPTTQHTQREPSFFLHPL